MPCFIAKLIGWPVDDVVLNIIKPTNEFLVQHFMDGL
jgi:hypothetical protein